MKNNRASRSKQISKIKMPRDNRKYIGILGVVAFMVIGVIAIAISMAADPANLSAQIIKTNYAYPSNAIFVSPSGSDTGSGSISSPFKTLQAGMNKASASGSTIVMRAGVYREQLNTVMKSVTIQPFPNEEVWLDGSEVVTGWVQDGQTWRKDGWTVAESLCPNSSCSESYFVTKDNPASGLPDMAFVNGMQLKQVLSLAEVKEGTFFVDRKAAKLYIGTNPAGKTVEASTKKQAIMYFRAGTAGSKLRGIGVRRYASNLTFSSKPSQVEVSNGAKGIEFDSMVFTESATNGLFVTGTPEDKSSGIVIKNSLFINNGSAGMTGNYTDGLLMENNIVHNNNTEKAEADGVYGTFGGVKISRMTNSTVKNNLFQDNFGTGFWCDLDCDGNNIIGNMARRNTLQGIFYEVSFNGIVASNIAYANGQYGYKINGRNVKIYNNTAYNNVSDGFFLYDDSRLPSQNLELVNNISANGSLTTNDSRLIYARINEGNIGDVMKKMDHNLYFRTSPTTPKFVLGWRGAGVNLQFTDFDDKLKQQTGRESNGVKVEGKAIGTLYKDVSSGNFQLVNGSAAIDSGQPLPIDVATAIGVPANKAVSRGAITWKNGASNNLATATPAPIVAPTPIPNKPPTVSLKLSGNNFKSPASFTVSVDAVDSDGSITKIEILQNGAVLTSCSNTPICRHTASEYPSGVFSFSARAYDNANPAGISSSDTQSVGVENPAPEPVAALLKPSNIRIGLEQGFFSYNLGMTWNKVEGATGYKVTPLGRSPVTRPGTGITVQNISKDVVYTYDIVAVNDKTESPKSTVQARMTCSWWVFDCKVNIISIK